MCATIQPTNKERKTQIMQNQTPKTGIIVENGIYYKLRTPDEEKKIARITQYRSKTKNFILNHASLEDIYKIEKYVEKRKKHLLQQTREKEQQC